MVNNHSTPSYLELKGALVADLYVFSGQILEVFRLQEKTNGKNFHREFHRCTARLDAFRCGRVQLQFLDTRG